MRESLLPHHASAPPEIVEACVMAEQKCTRCHTIGRVLSFEARTREQWEPLVSRMRRMASSGITPMDAERVLVCLTHGTRFNAPVPTRPAATMQQGFDPAPPDAAAPLLLDAGTAPPSDAPASERTHDLPVPSAAADAPPVDASAPHH